MEGAMSIYAPSTEGFRSLLRISRSSIASPPWFAAPIDAQEDENSVTVVFHVPVKSHGRVRVQASDQNVTVWGRSRAMRLCALPYLVDRNGIETSRSEDLLRVRIPKKRPATDSTDTSSTGPST
jgi:HSP20 family molecular chaperone IbpA